MFHKFSYIHTMKLVNVVLLYSIFLTILSIEARKNKGMKSQSPCSQFRSPGACQSTAALLQGCQWTVKQVCEGRKCKNFNYKCQPESFCDFNKGNIFYRQQQCSTSSGTCSWENNLCVPSTTPQTASPHSVSLAYTSRPSQPPVPVPVPNTCTSLSTKEKCNSQPVNCGWVSIDVCDYTVTPVTCQTFEYGCQQRYNFCDVTQGNYDQLLMQCNYLGFPCRFKKDQCVLETPSPTIENTAGEDIWNCNNLCPLAFDGICEVR